MLRVTSNWILPSGERERGIQSIRIFNRSMHTSVSISKWDLFWIRYHVAFHFILLTIFLAVSSCHIQSIFFMIVCDTHSSLANGHQPHSEMMRIYKKKTFVTIIKLFILWNRNTMENIVLGHERRIVLDVVILALSISLSLSLSRSLFLTLSLFLFLSPSCLHRINWIYT